MLQMVKTNSEKLVQGDKEGNTLKEFDYVNLVLVWRLRWIIRV